MHIFKFKVVIIQIRCNYNHAVFSHTRKVSDRNSSKDKMGPILVTGLSYPEMCMHKVENESNVLFSCFTPSNYK